MAASAEGSDLLSRLEQVSSLRQIRVCPCIASINCSSVTELIRIGNALPEGRSVRDEILVKLRSLKCSAPARTFRFE